MTTITQPRYVPTTAVRRPVAPSYVATPHLRPVPPVRAVSAPSRAAQVRSIFTGRKIAVLLLAFAAIFVGRLMISVATDANAYAIAERATESRNLTRDAQFIQEQLNVLNSPQHLSAAAQKLGMISNSQPAYIRMSDGKMWGNPRVAGGAVTEHTAIANALESTVLDNGSRQGVATSTATSREAESGQQTTVITTESTTSSSTGIPAPNTH